MPCTNIKDKKYKKKKILFENKMAFTLAISTNISYDLCVETITVFFCAENLKHSALTKSNPA